MAEYIEREAAIAAIMSEPPDAHYPHWYADKIKPIPAADVAPVKHGRWIEHKHFNHDHYIDSTYECSECKVEEPLTSDYCPNCGARMDGGKGNG